MTHFHSLRRAWPQLLLALLLLGADAPALANSGPGAGTPIPSFFVDPLGGS